MNADAIRQIYDYHITLNRRIWDKCVMKLTDEQFTQPCDYSVGSVRNQVVHMMSVDERWFSGLSGKDVPTFLNPVHYPTREKIRAYWDDVEALMREYLDALTDEAVQADYAEIKVWQVLVHVANHGTDHRAQLFAMMNPMGVHTFPQDMFFHFAGIDPSEKR